MLTIEKMFIMIDESSYENRWDLKLDKSKIN